MDELIRLCRKAANAWRNTDTYHQASVLIDLLCDRLEKNTAKPWTNADHIRAMNDEELAAFLSEWAERCLAWYGEYGETLVWLKEPVKDGDNDG